MVQAVLEALCLRSADHVASGTVHDDAEQLAATQACASLCLSIAVGCPQDQLGAASDASPVRPAVCLRGFDAPFLQQADSKRQLELIVLQAEGTAEKLDGLIGRHVSKGRLAAMSWRRTLAASPGIDMAEAWLAVRAQVETLFQVEHVPLHVAAGVLAYALTLLGAVPDIAARLNSGELSWLAEAAAALFAAGQSLVSQELLQVRQVV